MNPVPLDYIDNLFPDFWLSNSCENILGILGRKYLFTFLSLALPGVFKLVRDHRTGFRTDLVIEVIRRLGLLREIEVDLVSIFVVATLEPVKTTLRLRIGDFLPHSVGFQCFLDYLGSSAAILDFWRPSLRLFSSLRCSDVDYPVSLGLKSFFDLFLQVREEYSCDVNRYPDSDFDGLTISSGIGEELGVLGIIDDENRKSILHEVDIDLYDFGVV